jgi:hypothetical protein
MAMAMPTLPRKTGSNNPMGPSRVGAPIIAKQSALPSSQYLDALNILCESTMNEACALALSEKDYENNINGNADLKRLLELETTCRDAAKVIHEQAITVVAPAIISASLLPPPLTLPTMLPGAARAAKKTNAMAAPNKALLGKSIGAPTAGLMRRGSLASGRSGTLGKRHGQRQDNNNTDEGTSKKARLASGDGKSDAPPPSVLNFLKKLNQDKSASTTMTSLSSSLLDDKGTTTTTTKQSSTTTKVVEVVKSCKKEADKDSDNKQPQEQPQDELVDSDPSESGCDPSQSPPGGSKHLREGTRKNPTRGARK